MNRALDEPDAEEEGATKGTEAKHSAWIRLGRRFANAFPIISETHRISADFLVNALMAAWRAAKIPSSRELPASNLAIYNRRHPP